MKKLLFIALSFKLNLLFSQQNWDLEQCINYAKNHNIGLKQAALNNEINKNNTDQSKTSVLPSLNAGASHAYNFGQTIDRFTNTFANTQVLSQNFYLSSNVTLWSGLSQYNTIKANEFNYQSGIERLKQQECDLALSIANAYISVIFSEELLKTSINQLTVTKEQLTRTEKLVLAGALAKSAEFDLKAQLANEEVNATNAENNYQLSLLNLTQLMNLDSVTNFNISRPEIIIDENLSSNNAVTSIYDAALKNQPSIKSGEYQVLSADKTLAASKGRISPILSFNASLGTGTSGLAKRETGEYYFVTQSLETNAGTLNYQTRVPVLEKTPFAEQFKDNINKSIGFSLTVPLFNGLQTHTSVKNAKLSILNARFNQDLNKQNLYKNIVQAQANAKAALNKYVANKSSVDAAQESFKYAQQKFNAGAISAFDFNSAKSRLFISESNLIQAKYDYIFKLKVLDYYQGKPLNF